MKKLLLIGLLALPLAACSVSPTDAERALHAMGIKQVKMGGYAFFGCGEKDTFKSTFEGVGADGQRVTGVVCAGLFKGTTVRFD